jgi:hypothetical protein
MAYRYGCEPNYREHQEIRRNTRDCTSSTKEITMESKSKLETRRMKVSLIEPELLARAIKSGMSRSGRRLAKLYLNTSISSGPKTPTSMFF